MEGKCAFCEKDKTLQESHVLPAFAYRWLRERSGTGHIRTTDNPNRRVQDGLKLHWLCAQCEEKFSRFETAFATKVFHPWHEGNYRIPYESWMLKFCVSVSWRVLRFAYGKNPNPSYTAEQVELIRQAEQSWKAYLNDEIEHPGMFEQHLLIFDNIESTTATSLPSNFNRFMTGAITLDIIGSSRSIMTFAKMGRFMIFGIIQKGPDRWRGTKVSAGRGMLKPDKFTVPAGLLDLFKQKAALTADAMEGLSDAQVAKIEATILENQDRFISSDQFKSIMADAQMFGIQAVTRKR